MEHARYLILCKQNKSYAYKFIEEVKRKENMQPHWSCTEQSCVPLLVGELLERFFSTTHSNSGLDFSGEILRNHAIN
jgi:hypothetical protein